MLTNCSDGTTESTRAQVVTISLPADLLERGRHVASARRISFSAFVRGLILADLSDGGQPA